ncbi:MAG: alpha/beta hydrolase [Gemmatimonadaceae bacterium]
MRPTPLLLAVAGAATAIAVVARQLGAAAVRRELAERNPVGEGGIVPGAAAIELWHEDAPALLLLHGCGDTPQSMSALAAHLHAYGFSVRVPLLAGHGRTLREFADVSADEWVRQSRTELRRLRARASEVGIVGLSMGGALAAILASGDRKLSALVLVAPYLAMPPATRFLVRLHPLWGPLVPFVPGFGSDSIHDPVEAERNLAYGYFTPKALAALLAVADRGSALLPEVVAPTLILQSVEDNRLTREDGEDAFARLGSVRKEMVWTSGGGHVITVDHGRARVFREITRWMRSNMESAPTAR